MSSSMPAPQPVPWPFAAAHDRNHRQSGRLNTINRFLSIAAVLALLIAGASTAWMNRGNLGFGGGDGPSGPTQLAAITLPSGQTVQIAYEVPTKEDCTVAPLTVDEVMTKLRTRGWPMPTKPAGTPPPDVITTPDSASAMIPADHYDAQTFEALKAAQKQWLACSLYGSPFQRWALESNEFVQKEFQAAYMPVFDLTAIEADLTKLEAGEDIGRFTTPPVTDDGYLPMVIDTAEGYYNVLNPNGSAAISILWMKADGSILQPFGATEDEPGIQNYLSASRLEQTLPNVWTFRKDATTGVWLLDSLSIGMG